MGDCTAETTFPCCLFPTTKGIIMRYYLLALLLPLTLCQCTYAQEQLSASKLRQKLEQATVLVTTNRGHGTGWVIDHHEKLIATANHVIAGTHRVAVQFSCFSQGKCIQDRDILSERSPLIEAKVVASHSVLDFAILRVSSIPSGVKSLPLAKTTPATGSTIYSVSHASKMGTLFNFDKANIEFTGFAAVSVAGVHQPDTSIRAEVMVFQSNAVDTGSSGCAFINNQGEVVGYCVCGSGLIDKSKVNRVAVSVRELQRLLHPAQKKAGEPSSVIGRWVGKMKNGNGEIGIELCENGKGVFIVPGGGKIMGYYRLVDNTLRFTRNGKTEVIQFHWLSGNRFRLAGEDLEATCQRHDGGW